MRFGVRSVRAAVGITALQPVETKGTSAVVRHAQNGFRCTDVGSELESRCLSGQGRVQATALVVFTQAEQYFVLFQLSCTGFHKHCGIKIRQCFLSISL